MPCCRSKPWLGRQFVPIHPDGFAYTTRQEKIRVIAPSGTSTEGSAKLSTLRPGCLRLHSHSPRALVKLPRGVVQVAYRRFGRGRYCLADFKWSRALTPDSSNAFWSCGRSTTLAMVSCFVRKALIASGDAAPLSSRSSHSRAKCRYCSDVRFATAPCSACFQ